MRKRSAGIVVAAGLAVVGIAGCASIGLSPREVRGQDYATYVYSMYAPAAVATSPASAHQPVAMPAKVAVAQLGEVAPPLTMLERLRKEHETFTTVLPIPAVVNPSGVDPTYADPSHGSRKRGGLSEEASHKLAAEHGQRMRRYAQDIGADYLFLYGGTVDEATTETPLTLANLTIIGAFIVPSEKVQAQARASGSLIDVKSGRVMLAVSADSSKSRFSSAVGSETDRLSLLKSLREDVITQLADQLTARMKEQATGPTGNTRG